MSAVPSELKSDLSVMIYSAVFSRQRKVVVRNENCVLLMYYYDTQTPEEIARAIMTVDVVDDHDGRKIISQLDAGFRSELVKLLEVRT